MNYPGSPQPTNYPARPQPTEDEQLQALLGLSGVTDQADLVKEQLAQALALRQPSGQDYHTGLGAGLGGLGDIVRNIAGGVKEHGLRDQLSGLQGQLAEGRKTYGNSLLSLFRGMQRPPTGTGTVLRGPQDPSADDAVRAALPGAFTFGGY